MLKSVQNAVSSVNIFARARDAVIGYYSNPGKHIDLANMREYSRHGRNGNPEYIVEIKSFEDVSGFKKLGSGCYSDVYALDDTRVLKIVKKKDSGYARFVEICKKNRNNPHLPRILYSGMWAGKQIYVLERLRNDQYSKANDNFRSALSLGNNPYITYGNKDIAELARLLKDNNLTNDLHSGNVMFRGDVPIVTDPCSE